MPHATQTILLWTSFEPCRLEVSSQSVSRPWTRYFIMLDGLGQSVVALVQVYLPTETESTNGSSKSAGHT